MEEHYDESDSQVEMNDKNLAGNCYVCNNYIGEVTSKNSVDIFNDKLTGTPAAFILSSIFNRQLTEESVHSKILCENCFKLCTEFEEVEQRFIEIRLELIRNFNRTSIKHNLVPVEVEDDEVDQSMEMDDHDEITDSIDLTDENNLNEITPNSIMPGEIVNLDNENIIVVGKIPFLKVFSNHQNKNSNEFHHDGDGGIDIDSDGHNDNIEVEYDSPGDFKQESESREEYFNEDNMVEIVAENDDYPNIIVENQVSISDESSKIPDSVENFDDTSKTSENSKDMLFLNIKAEPGDEETRQPKKKQKLNKSAEKEEVLINSEDIFLRDGTNFECRLCNENDIVTYDTRTIGIHLKSVHDIKIFFCDMCGLDFRKRNEFTDHLDEHTEANEDGYFTCEICKRVFNNIRLFRIHKKIHNTNSKSWECDKCNKKFCSKNLLVVHMNMHTGVRPYKCSKCDKDFASKYTLTAHMKIHSNRPRPYACKTCNKSFYSGQHLFQHEKTHSGVKPYLCESCDKSFSTQHNLEVHKIVHTGFKPFTCKTCGKAFARRAEIKDHERIHTGEKPFKCDICSASFAQRSNLQSHKRATHFDDKRYQCDICDRRFKRRRLLDYHKNATHTGERPYRCTLCASTFVYPEHYKKHMRIHSGIKPYSCEICKKTFNSRDNRNAHRFIHSDKKPYECTICGQGFMRKPLLFVHMKQASHLHDKIIINQPRITTESGDLLITGDDPSPKQIFKCNVLNYVTTDSKTGAPEVKFKTEKVIIDRDNQNEDFLTVFEANDYEYLEEDIEEEEISEENLIIDGQVQFGGEQVTGEELSAEEILDNDQFTEVMESGEILVSEDGQIFESENGTVQYVKINFNGKDQTGTWMKVES